MVHTTTNGHYAMLEDGNPLRGPAADTETETNLASIPSYKGNGNLFTLRNYCVIINLGPGKNIFSLGSIFLFHLSPGLFLKGVFASISEK